MGTWQSRSTQICGCRFGASLTEALASRNRANRQFLAFLGPFCTQCWPTAAPARHGRFPTPKCCGNLAQGRGAASKNVGHFRCTNQSIADNFPLKLNGRHGGATKDTKCKGDILGRNLGAKSWGEILRPNTGAEYWGRILGTCDGSLFILLGTLGLGLSGLGLAIFMPQTATVDPALNPEDDLADLGLMT